LMFQPDGGVDSLFLNDWPFAPPTTIHFLLGRADRIGASPTTAGSSTSHPSTVAMYDQALSNLADFQALWVSISRSTGNVGTSDNQPPVIDPTTASASQIILFNGTPQKQVLNPTNIADQATFLSYCRMLATNREQARTN